MPRFTGYILAFFMVGVTICSAQESGVFLHFTTKPNLNMEITASASKTAGEAVLYESPTSDSARIAFDRVLFNGTVSDTNLILQLRYQDDSGRWSSWNDVYTRYFPNGRFWARYDRKDGIMRHIRYRILNGRALFPVQIEIYAIEGIKQAKEQQIQSPSSHKTAIQKMTVVPEDSIPQPALISRAEWEANDPIGTLIPHQPFRMTQHHTAGARIATLQQGIAEMQFIQDFHQNGRGWQDIGYHYCMDDSGRIYQGVLPDYRGTHVGGNNTGNLGISYMGNFHIEGNVPTEKALANLVDMWSWLSYSYDISPDSLMGHRNFSATACPGDNLYTEILNIRNEVRNQLGFGAPYIANPSPQPFSEGNPRNSAVSFFIRDDEEGVDAETLVMQINGETVSPLYGGTQNELQVLYEPETPFPYAQTVIVDVQVSDLAEEPRTMNYGFRFKIEVEALYSEVINSMTMRNGHLEVLGEWQTDNFDLDLEGLTSGQRLKTTDDDGSHYATVYPDVSEAGDYNVYMASASNYLGESARYIFVNEYGMNAQRFVEYNDVYYRKWAPISPTPVYMDSTGFIQLGGLEGLPTRLILDAFRLEKVDKLDPPHAPDMKYVRPNAQYNRMLEIDWYPSLEGDIAGYRLFLSEDGLNWGEPLADENVLKRNVTTFLYEYTGDAASLYFRVVAVDTNTFIGALGEDEPLLSEPSDTYGTSIGREPQVLIVDNFDRQASWRSPHHPFVKNYGEAVVENGIGFASCYFSAVQNGDIDPMEYDVVIYICGDDSRSDESLAAADQFRLMDYLEAGGKVFISGSEIGYDIDGSATEEKIRYQELLKARYQGDLAGSNRVIGETGTVFEGLDFEYGTMTGPDLYIEDYPDYIQPYGGSNSALFYGNLQIAGIHYTGPYVQGGPDAQLVYIGFTFETIVQPEARSALLGRVLQYFGLATDINEEKALIPANYELSQNFPNPFNPSTTFQVSIPVAAEVRELKLTIYNALGQKIRTLKNGRIDPGIHTIKWNGMDDTGILAASGIYYCRMEIGDFAETRKMVLVR